MFRPGFRRGSERFGGFSGRKTTLFRRCSDDFRRGSERFPTISEDVPKISEGCPRGSRPCPKGVRGVSDHFRRFPEDFRRVSEGFPTISEDIPKISEGCPRGSRPFPKISRRFPRDEYVSLLNVTKTLLMYFFLHQSHQSLNYPIRSILKQPITCTLHRF